MGRWLDDLGEAQKHEPIKPTVPKRGGFHAIEEIGLADGWRQIVAGEWKGVGLLDVLEGQQHTWGRRIIIAEPGRDRGKLQENYPGAMIFTPAEFQDAVNHWPGDAAAIQAKKTFSGDISE